MKAPRFWRIRAWWARRKEKAVVAILFALPDHWKNRITVHRIGEMTATKPSLQTAEVPFITVDQILEAMSEVNG